MRRQVDDRNVVAGERARHVVGRLGIRKKLVPPCLRPGERPAADHRDIETGRAVGIEVRGRDAPGADERDPRPVVPRHGRPVWQIGRRDLGGLRALQAVGVEVRRLGHATRGTRTLAGGGKHGAVHDPLADQAELGVERAGDRRTVRDARQHVLDRRAAAGWKHIDRNAHMRGLSPRLQRDVIVVVVAGDAAVSPDQHEAAFRLRLLASRGRSACPSGSRTWKDRAA